MPLIDFADFEEPPIPSEEVESVDAFLVGEGDLPISFFKDPGKDLEECFSVFEPLSSETLRVARLVQSPVPSSPSSPVSFV